MNHGKPIEPAPAEPLSECPVCSGTGKLLGVFPVYAEDVPQADRKPCIEFDCMKCGGTGKVTATQLWRIAAGNLSKQERLSRDMTLREEAERLGILPSELSRLENGHV